jgi:hypothetical protein
MEIDLIDLTEDQIRQGRERQAQLFWLSPAWVQSDLDVPDEVRSAFAQYMKAVASFEQDAGLYSDTGKTFPVSMVVPFGSCTNCS